MREKFTSSKIGGKQLLRTFAGIPEFADRVSAQSTMEVKGTSRKVKGEFVIICVPI